MAGQQGGYQGMKTALIITYYWPPAGGPGVQRWLKFAKYLPENGIRPVVYTPSNPFYPIRDASLLEEIPPEIEILKQPIREPYNLARLVAKGKTREMSSGVIDSDKDSLLQRLMLYIRGNYFIPDARVGWVGPSVSFLKDYLTGHNVDWIITTGPPHSLHLIGLKLKELTGVSWLADFRDPWTTIHYHDKLRLSGRSKKKHKELELAVLKAADKVVATSSWTKKEFETLAGREVVTITNGFDGRVPKATKAPERFVLAHIGSLLSERNPTELWKSLGQMVARQNDFREDFVLQLAGKVSSKVVRAIEEAGLKNHLELRGYVPHEQARALQQKAAVLLLLESDRRETRAIIPAKLFEYLAARRPVLAMGPAGSEVKDILEESGSGHFFGYQESQNIQESLATWYQHFKRGDLSVKPGNIERYSRRDLTRQLADLLG